MIPPAHLPPTAQKQLHYVCYRAPGAAMIDGRIDKPFWADAPWTEDFVDIEGDAKPRPRHRTRAKLLWDDECLYVAAELEEPHLWATLTQRDSIVFHDNDFEVFLSPTGDNHNYYEFEVNALNTVFDLFLPKPYRDGGPADHGWDVKGLRSAVQLDGTLNDPSDIDRRWTVEVAFPWAAFDRHGGLRCPPRDQEQWRLNFSRVHWDLDVAGGVYRKKPDLPEHNWVWSPQGIVDMHRPEQWGYLQFSGLMAGRGRAALVPDRAAAARRALHCVYYAQLAHRAKTGLWAGSWEELSCEPGITTESDGLDGPLVVSRTADGWEATQSVRHSDGGRERWHIRQDSLLWADA